MNRLALHGALTLTILFYSLLPYLDKKVWHAFVPEHQHWLVANTLVAQAQADADCDSCATDTASSANPGETLIHAFSLTFGLQFFSVIISLFGLFVLIMPCSLSFRLVTSPLFSKSALLLPPEPPPTFA